MAQVADVREGMLVTLDGRRVVYLDRGDPHGFPLLACSTMPAKACKRWPPLIGVGAVAALAVFMAFWHWTWSASSSGGAPMERALSAILLIVKARPLCGATGPMGRRGHQSPCEPDGLEVGQAP